jgi:AAA domain (Cdc48 subfamily)
MEQAITKVHRHVCPDGCEHRATQVTQEIRAHFLALTKLEFCKYDTASVAAFLNVAKGQLKQLSRVALTACKFVNKGNFPALEAISFVKCTGQTFMARVVASCKHVALEECQGMLEWESDQVDYAIESLMIHKPSFTLEALQNGMPASIGELHLVEWAELTPDKVLEYLPKHITHLVVDDCAAVTEGLTHGRLSNKFKSLVKSNLPSSPVDIVEKLLGELVMEQPEAIKAATNAILALEEGAVRDNDHPIKLCFAGPTGVGKTELAISIARVTGRPLLHLDMGMFRGDDAVNQLTGASPGYVGYKTGKSVVKAVREDPRTIVLFDEIDRAHESIHNVLFRLLDEGKLRGADGEEADFSKTMIILTTNLGDEQLVGLDWENSEDVEKAHEIVASKIRAIFGDAFAGRLVDSLVPFRYLKLPALRHIFRAKIGGFLNDLHDISGRQFFITDDDIDRFMEGAEADKDNLGFRHAWQRCTSPIIDQANRMITNGSVPEGYGIKIALEGTGIVLETINLLDNNKQGLVQKGFRSKAGFLAEKSLLQWFEKQVEQYASSIERRARPLLTQFLRKLANAAEGVSQRLLAEVVGTKIAEHIENVVRPAIKDLEKAFGVSFNVDKLSNATIGHLARIATNPRLWDTFQRKLTAKARKAYGAPQNGNLHEEEAPNPDPIDWGKQLYMDDSVEFVEGLNNNSNNSGYWMGWNETPNGSDGNAV